MWTRADLDCEGCRPCTVCDGQACAETNGQQCDDCLNITCPEHEGQCCEAAAAS